MHDRLMSEMTYFPSFRDVGTPEHQRGVLGGGGTNFFHLLYSAVPISVFEVEEEGRGQRGEGEKVLAATQVLFLISSFPSMMLRAGSKAGEIKKRRKGRDSKKKEGGVRGPRPARILILLRKLGREREKGI